MVRLKLPIDIADAKIKRQRRVITSRVFRFVRESLGRQLPLVAIEGVLQYFCANSASYCHGHFLSRVAIR